MINSFVAEMDKSVRRPATWVLVAVWAIAAIVFVYLTPYIKYATPASSVSAAARQALLTSMLPEKMVAGVIAGFPVFGGAIALVFGALVMGSEYSWGTLKTVFVQRPSRLSVLSGKLLALGVMQVVFVLAVFVPGAVSSFVVAMVTHSSVSWPEAGDFAQGLGAAWLIMTMWAMLGALFATILRGATLAVGLGLFFLLLEQLFASTASLSELLTNISKALPGSNAGALAAALSPSSGTPGVAAVVGTTQAILVLAAYVAGFVLLSILLFLKRDVM
jgi:ABC-2 type transport system permease protein